MLSPIAGSWYQLPPKHTQVLILGLASGRTQPQDKHEPSMCTWVRGGEKRWWHAPKHGSMRRTETEALYLMEHRVWAGSDENRSCLLIKKVYLLFGKQWGSMKAFLKEGKRTCCGLAVRDQGTCQHGWGFRSEWNKPGQGGTTFRSWEKLQTPPHRNTHQHIHTICWGIFKCSLTPLWSTAMDLLQLSKRVVRSSRCWVRN